MKNKKRIEALEEQVRILMKCSGNVSKTESEDKKKEALNQARKDTNNAIEEAIKNIEKTSIREVQVKISSQEEANECAEIAKACGEKIGSEFSMSFNRMCQYFFVNSSQECGVYAFNINKTEISIQEYRESFGKPATEIDWSKAGQLLENNICVIINLGNTNHKSYFDGVVLIKKTNDCLDVGSKTRFDKDCFKLCTEPITLNGNSAKQLL